MKNDVKTTVGLILFISFTVLFFFWIMPQESHVQMQVHQTGDGYEVTVKDEKGRRLICQVCSKEACCVILRNNVQSCYCQDHKPDFKKKHSLSQH